MIQQIDKLIFSSNAIFAQKINPSRRYVTLRDALTFILLPPIDKKYNGNRLFEIINKLISPINIQSILIEQLGTENGYISHLYRTEKLIAISLINSLKYSGTFKFITTTGLKTLDQLKKGDTILKVIS